jgi:hypothetical protein
MNEETRTQDGAVLQPATHWLHWHTHTRRDPPVDKRRPNNDECCETVMYCLSLYLAVLNRMRSVTLVESTDTDRDCSVRIGYNSALSSLGAALNIFELHDILLTLHPGANIKIRFIVQVRQENGTEFFKKYPL